ncbi:glycosyltransferase family 2 protein [Paenibacillus sp. sgz5001063]|uniref:glycosyltransferase family 2 protein n=1 Tax=Paenibacillus sp. sgz5001063 TaxID=3242474 RepID=UPI0036D25E46
MRAVMSESISSSRQKTPAALPARGAKDQARQTAAVRRARAALSGASAASVSPGATAQGSSAAALIEAAGASSSRRNGAVRSIGRRKKTPAATAGGAAVRRSTTGSPASNRQRVGRPSRRVAAGVKARGSSTYRGAKPQLPQLNGALSVIISARNERQALPGLLKQVERLHPAEIIVVLNGCTDDSYKFARLCKQAAVVHCPESAGHDVGRAIGAKLSRGDILLFLDGDMVIPAPQLAIFAAAVDGGVDVALNDLDMLLPAFGLSDDVTRCKLYLNSVLGRSDLGVSSMTAVPHALSRRALERIGYRELMVPPKAQAISIIEQLRVEKAGTVNVIKRNRLRQGNIGAGNAIEQLITGDHAEALLRVLIHRDKSCGFTGENLLEQRRQLAAWRNSL